MKLKINMMKKQITAMEEEEDHEEELKETNNYSWDALLEAISSRISREELLTSVMPKKGPHFLRYNRNDYGPTSTSYSKKLVEEDTLSDVSVLFDFPIPKKKRGPSRDARKQEKALLKVSKLIGERMMRRITFNTSSDHHMPREEEEEEEEKDYVLKRKRRHDKIEVEKAKRARPLARGNIEISNLPDGFMRKILAREEEEKEGLLKRKRPEEKIKVENVKRARPLVGNIEIPYPPPNLPDGFMRKILAMGTHTKLQLVITKRLSPTDCKKKEGRLSMPLAQIVDFLEEHEKILLEGRKKIDKKNDIDVVLIQPNLNLEAIDIKLRQWEMNSSKMYVLVKPWNDVVLNNGLEAGDVIQIWSFRFDRTLGLAIVKLSNGEGEDDVHTRRNS